MNNQYQNNVGVYYNPAQNNTQQGSAPASVAYNYKPNMKPLLKAQKEYEPFTKKDSVFLLLIFIAGFLFIDFALTKGFHLGFTVSYFVIFIISTLFVRNKNAKCGAFEIICGALSLAGSVTLSLYYNALINTITVILITGLFTVYLLGISGSAKRKKSNFKFLFDLFETTFISPFENMGDVFGSMKSSAKKSKKYISALLGVMISLPVLLVVIPLLVESDAAFEGLIKFIAKNIGIYLAELLGACIILPYTFSYMYGKKHRLNNADIKSRKTDLRKMPLASCISFLCVISVTYLVYLFSQLAYFFSAFKGLLPEGYTRTASAFARRGFFEMFAICVINVLIISIVSAFSKRAENGKRSLMIKLMSLFITLFSLLLIATAMQKMKLNISTYGFTVNRLLISILMIMILVVLIFFIIHIFAPKVSYMQPIIIICSAIFIAAGFVNLDSITASYNISIYEKSEKPYIDVAEIQSLGVDAIPDLITLAKSNKTADISHAAEMALIKTVYEEYSNDAYKNNYGDFRAYYYARERAHKAVSEYEKSLDENKKGAYKETVNMMKNDNYTYISTDYSDEDDIDYFVNYNNNTEYHYNKKTKRYDIKKSIYDGEEL